MYFELDMPKILNDFTKFKNNSFLQMKKYIKWIDYE